MLCQPQGAAIPKHFVVGSDIDVIRKHVVSLQEESGKQWVWIICNHENGDLLESEFEHKSVYVFRAKDIDNVCIYVFHTELRRREPENIWDLAEWDYFLNGRNLGSGEEGLLAVINSLDRVKPDQACVFFQRQIPSGALTFVKGSQPTVGRPDIPPGGTLIVPGASQSVVESWDERLTKKLKSIRAVRFHFHEQSFKFAGRDDYRSPTVTGESRAKED